METLQIPIRPNPSNPSNPCSKTSSPLLTLSMSHGAERLFRKFIYLKAVKLG